MRDGMTMPREKVFVGLVFLGVGLAIATLVVGTAELRAGREPPVGVRKTRALDSDVARAVPRAAMYWFGAGALGAFAGAYMIRER